jgi:hypothetical protein
MPKEMNVGVLDASLTGPPLDDLEDPVARERSSEA